MAISLELWSTKTDGTPYPIPNHSITIRGSELPAVIEALRQAISLTDYEVSS